MADALTRCAERCASGEATAYLVEVSFRLLNPRGGYRVSTAGPAPVLYAVGGAFTDSVGGLDYDGVRCRYPCLDGNHQAPVDLVLLTEAAHEIVASGREESRAPAATPGWMAELGSGVCHRSWWFVGPAVHARAVGFVAGGLRRVGEGGPVVQWAGSEVDAAQVMHCAAGLEAAALSIGEELLGPGFAHAQVWLPLDADSCVFANVALVSTRLLHGVEHADPQLPRLAKRTPRCETA